jgi:putative DNA primase/helicase
MANSIVSEAASIPGAASKPKKTKNGNTGKLPAKPVLQVAKKKEVEALKVETLQQLLTMLPEGVEFGAKLEDGSHKKPTQKDYLVKTIRILLRIVENNNIGLCSHNEQIYLFKGSHWKAISSNDFEKFLCQAAIKMGVESTTAEIYGFKKQLVKQFLSTANLTTPKRLNKCTLINLRNGTYQVCADNSSLRSVAKEDFLTYQLPFDYDPKAEAPEFMKYLNKVLPEKELQTALAEFMGYVFAKDLKLEKCLLLYGSGANGKSVFFEIINALLGKDNVSNFSLSDLNKEYNRAQIADKLLNYGSEINKSIEGDRFKQLASGEPTQARMKYKNAVTITDYARLMFNCNELPSTAEQTEAYFRRFLIIPFKVTIKEGERDATLAQRIIEKELSGVFNWMLKGLKSILKNQRFVESKVISDILKTYKEESDTVFQFIKDFSYSPSKNQKQTFIEVYGAYTDYCQNYGFRRLTSIAFSKKMREHKFETHRGTGGIKEIYIEVKKV